MRIGDDFLGDPVAPLGIGIRDPVTQRVRGQVLVGVVQMALVVEEGLPVADEVLQVAYLRLIDGRVVDLVQDTLGDGEPDPAQRRVRGPYPVLVAAGPAGLDPGTTARRMLAQ